MTDRTYPYQAWTLTPSFRPKEVTLTRTYSSWRRDDYGDLTDAGRLIARSDIFPTKGDAIAAGWERIHKQEAKLAKMQANIDKKRAALAVSMESCGVDE